MPQRSGAKGVIGELWPRLQPARASSDRHVALAIGTA
jgi:hypothetical protein